MSTHPLPPRDDSDSEDEDYVPPAEDDSSDDDRPDAKRARLEPEINEEEQKRKKKERDALWATFQASLSTPPSAKIEDLPKKLVKIEKRYLFAGKEVVDIVEVPEDSPDAKKWPLWRTPIDSVTATDSPDPTKEEKVIANTTDNSVTSTTPIAPSSTPAAAKTPGPRKRRTLAAVPTGSQKAKKLTTLDKSAMDWRAHVNSELEPDKKDELEVNRRGGGYLEKVEFLKRVENRKEDALGASKSKRRRA